MPASAAALLRLSTFLRRRCVQVEGELKGEPESSRIKMLFVYAACGDCILLDRGTQLIFGAGPSIYENDKSRQCGEVKAKRTAPRKGLWLDIRWFERCRIMLERKNNECISLKRSRDKRIRLKSRLRLTT